MNIDQYDDWEYLAEGNAHLVLSYVGQDRLLTGKVLRLTKRNNALSVDFDLQFMDDIIAPLVGGTHVDRAEKVAVSDTFLQAMQHKIQPQQPTHRRGLALTTSATLLSDYTRTFAPRPTWTFEVKPKWGFLPRSPWIDEKHSDLKQTMCRFCMHQRLRGKEQSATWPYCPLDLFSGDHDKMERALMASLMVSHGYLNMFYNGLRITAAEDQKQRFQELFSSPDLSRQDVCKRVARLLCTLLVRDPLLATLKHLQQTLDGLDVEGIYPMLQAHQPLSTEMAVWKEVLKTYQARAPDDWQGKKVLPWDEQRQRLYEYVLSMTFKDCSLMISVTKADNDRALPNSVHVFGQWFKFEIKMVDVGLKEWAKIPYWFDLDQQIVQYNLQCRTPRDCGSSSLQ
ncbi:DUF941-domain-containing protein [Hesseltinella vesiculosa]|uniref:Inositol-pentakisphosphate 2-kinase n=1 Tax=Hesseltinella vesiculosa TaxID=101127 RepID=A0A1X2GWH8_9FUNG|nr:DUF941-domain-containing protein [Hesseltinella vesiculosa]